MREKFKASPAVRNIVITKYGEYAAKILDQTYALTDLLDFGGADADVTALLQGIRLLQRDFIDAAIKAALPKVH